MSWNGSNQTSTSPDKRPDADASARPRSPRTKHEARGTKHGLLAGALVVVLGAAALWFFTRPAPPAAPSAAPAPKSAAKIAEATPAVVTNDSHAVVRHGNYTNEDRLAYFERRYGTNIPERLKTTVYFLKHPPEHTYRPPPRREDIFQHHSERSIASMLLMRPGTFVMQRVSYDENFDNDFKKSLETPTLMLKDDTAEQRELKEAVNDVKAELAERMRSGEKPSEIMTAAMEDAYELGKYRMEMEQLVRDMRDDPQHSDQDYEDFVAAANKLLRSKGADELHLKSVVSRSARLKMLARKAEENQKTINEQKGINTK